MNEDKQEESEQTCAGDEERDVLHAGPTAGELRSLREGAPTRPIDGGKTALLAVSVHR